MKITLQGAAGGEVTGSAYIVESDKARVLVDYGLFQGNAQTEEQNKRPLAGGHAFDAVLLTHAHLDHTGRLPLLTRNGYAGPIFATQATIDLAQIIVADAAHIQVADARHDRKRDPDARPLYLEQDADALKPLFQPVAYDTPVDVADGMTGRWIESGHMLGSGSIELTVRDSGRKRVIIFSGDIGPRHAPIVRDPETLDFAHLVFLESTYGDRNHRPYRETAAEFERIVQEAVAERAKILVPAFAVGRVQQIIYHMASMYERKLVAPFPIAVDSPMAIAASRAFINNAELFDEDALAVFGTQPGQHGLELIAAETADQSRALYDLEGPCMILAPSGMCTGGRILHHLKNDLPNPHTYVLIVGYQGEGSLGRQLVEGAPEVRIYGETVPVRAKVATLNGFSGHAGQSELLGWFGNLAPAKPRVVLTHGENKQRGAMADLIQSRHGLDSARPAIGDEIEL